MTFAVETDYPERTDGAAAGGIGAVFRCARNAQSLSGDALAQATGLSRRTIIKIEQGDDSVAFGSYRAVARVLGVDWLLDVFCGTAREECAHSPQYYLSGTTALSLPPEDGRPPALWYSSSLGNPKSWRIAGKHLTHTGHLIGVVDLWDATTAIARYGVTVPRLWVASPERAVFDLLIDHCEIKGKTVPNVQASDVDDVVSLSRVAQWVDMCEPFLSQKGIASIREWIEGGDW
ncbi:MAG: XRE family transcriptional regulator [Halomonadaceae bacterium]|nr:MAG: XRE family transcriptional regulator [Halomonadaceae bacterium]